MTRTVKEPEERRRELLACAMRLFAEQGYDNVSVRAVARAAGVAPGLAYHYFDSKQALFSAAIEDYARRCAEGVCAVLDERGPSLDERLDRALEADAAERGAAAKDADELAAIMVYGCVGLASGPGMPDDVGVQ